MGSLSLGREVSRKSLCINALKTFVLAVAERGNTLIRMIRRGLIQSFRRFGDV